MKLSWPRPRPAWKREPREQHEFESAAHPDTPEPQLHGVLQDQSLAFLLGRLILLLMVCGILWFMLSGLFKGIRAILRGLRRLMYRWLAAEHDPEAGPCLWCGRVGKEEGDGD